MSVLRESRTGLFRDICARCFLSLRSVGTPYTRVHEGGWRGRPSAELGDTGTAPHCRALWPRSRLPLASLLFLTRPAALARPRALAATATAAFLRAQSALAFTRVSGNPEGNQRVPSTLSFRKFPGNSDGVWCSIPAPFWQLSSFPESESWFGAKSEANPRKPANYAGIFQIYPGFSRYTCRMPRYFADLADFGPKSADFNRVSPGN